MNRICIAATLVTLAVAPHARAAPTPEPSSPPAAPAPAATAVSAEARALAETLFFTARGLMEAERYPEACRKLEESHRLDPASGTLLNLALCHEKEGRVASSWGEYRQALTEARRAQRADRVAVCEERIAALEPILPRLQIDVPESVRVPRLVISRNGLDLEAAAWGTPLPTDPGVVEIVAHAPGYQPRKSSITIALSGRETVTIGALTLLPPPPPSVVREGGWSGRKIAGASTFVAGVLGLGAGAVLGALTLDQKNSSDDKCPSLDGERRCTDGGVKAMDRAETLALGSNIAFGVGAVAMVVGAVLFVTGRPSTSQAASQLTKSLAARRLTLSF